MQVIQNVLRMLFSPTNKKSVVSVILFVASRKECLHSTFRFWSPSSVPLNFLMTLIIALCLQLACFLPRLVGLAIGFYGTVEKMEVFDCVWFSIVVVNTVGYGPPHFFGKVS